MNCWWVGGGIRKVGGELLVGKGGGGIRKVEGELLVGRGGD